MPIRRSPNDARHPVHRLVAIPRNRWSRSIGTPGRDQSEWLVAITRCAHSGATVAMAGWRRMRRCLPEKEIRMSRRPFPPWLGKPRAIVALAARWVTSRRNG